MEDELANLANPALFTRRGMHLTLPRLVLTPRVPVELNSPPTERQMPTNPQDMETLWRNATNSMLNNH